MSERPEGITEAEWGIVGAAMNEGIDGMTTLNASGHAALTRIQDHVRRTEAERDGLRNLRALVDRDTSQKDALQARIEALEGALREAEACDIARRAGDQSYEDDRIERTARAALAGEPEVTSPRVLHTGEGIHGSGKTLRWAGEPEPPATCPTCGSYLPEMQGMSQYWERGMVGDTWHPFVIDYRDCPDPWHTVPTCPTCGSRKPSFNPLRIKSRTYSERCQDPWHTVPTGTTEHRHDDGTDYNGCTVPTGTEEPEMCSKPGCPYPYHGWPCHEGEK